MVQLRPLLTLPTAFPTSALEPTPQAASVGIDDVKGVQAALNTLGANPPLDVDGNYGIKTRRAVASFQRAHGLDDDGIAGPATKQSLTTALAASKAA
jgi:peptidoglycan hydrolase-like protein with peptidoglycan-binding domain